jgi:voltage-gated potassium channel
MVEGVGERLHSRSNRWKGAFHSMQAITLRLKIFLILFFIVIVLGTVGFVLIEEKSIIEAVYFVIVTMATVGYGDIHPTTQLGRVFTIFLIVTGVGTFLGVIANLTEMMLAKREIESLMKKLNMVIGVFYSEVGINLMNFFSQSDREAERMRSDLLVSANWTDKQFKTATDNLKKYDFNIEMELIDLEVLKDFICNKREFLVRLLENPILLEHQSFTDLLLAVFHFTEELAYRDDVKTIPESDRNHLTNDIKRAYQLLTNEWLDYMRYLKADYPFLFHLAMRTNPFDRSASITVK